MLRTPEMCALSCEYFKIYRLSMKRFSLVSGIWPSILCVGFWMWSGMRQSNGKAQCPTEFRQSATGQSGISQPKRGPEVTQSLSKLDSQWIWGRHRHMVKIWKEDAQETPLSPRSPKYFAVSVISHGLGLGHSASELLLLVPNSRVRDLVRLQMSKLIPRTHKSQLWNLQLEWPLLR